MLLLPAEMTAAAAAAAAAAVTVSFNPWLSGASMIRKDRPYSKYKDGLLNQIIDGIFSKLII